MDRVIRLVVIGAILVPYALGLVSGWYGRHPHPDLLDPDAYVHSGCFLVLALEVGQAWKAWRGKRKANEL